MAFLGKRGDERKSVKKLVNKNVVIGDKRTSMRLEPEMWGALDEICRREDITPHSFCTDVARRHTLSSLTAAVRVEIMKYFREAATERGHFSAGHGASPAKPQLVPMVGTCSPADVWDIRERA